MIYKGTRVICLECKWEGKAGQHYNTDREHICQRCHTPVVEFKGYEKLREQLSNRSSK